MFGEEPILGQNELTLDKKGRIFIPAHTKREQGESLVLIYDKDLDIYEIYSKAKYSEILEILTKKYLAAETKLEEIKYKKKIYEIGKSVLRESKIDSQGRFLTGNIFEGEDKLLSIGCHDHLKIEKIKTKK